MLLTCVGPLLACVRGFIRRVALESVLRVLLGFGWGLSSRSRSLVKNAGLDLYTYVYVCVYVYIYIGRVLEAFCGLVV